MGTAIGMVGIVEHASGAGGGIIRLPGAWGREEQGNGRAGVRPALPVILNAAEGFRSKQSVLRGVPAWKAIHEARAANFTQDFVGKTV